ncbi:DUF6221 family protein [Thermoactinospora rubra]|uniref:DUF6221 family protein n=1 Tax=Thermoactinospora rubra TaxID=1088767 RepID=UPI00117BFDB9|nr:DUF6221 family protein [Thermoactinospora rubra]
MDDLTAFVRARLDEDERAARRAAEVCGCHPPASSWIFDDEATDGRILVVDDPHPDVKRKLGRRWNGTYNGLFTAEHIARHDPARVLREVEARRRLVGLTEYMGGWNTEHDTQVTEHEIHSMRQAAHEMLRNLAAPYADHPDYQEEWRS